MTILEAYCKLAEFFSENSVFNLSQDFKKAVLITETENQDKAAILCALEEMEKGGMVRRAKVDGEDFFVLFKALDSFSQSLEVSGLVAHGIAGIVNSVSESVGNESLKCDPRSITEGDLKNLIFIASKVDPQKLKN